MAEIFDKPLGHWDSFDSWSLDLACKLVTVGYPADLEVREKALKDLLPDTTTGIVSSLASLSAMKQVINRARDIAQTSVAAAEIKDPDTPTNWIKWAKGKNYKVAHLERYISQAPNESATDERSKKVRAALRAKAVPNTRGCKRIILENWDAICKEYGPAADGTQVLRWLKNAKVCERMPALKTIRNHLPQLKTQNLIP